VICSVLLLIWHRYNAYGRSELRVVRRQARPIRSDAKNDLVVAVTRLGTWIWISSYYTASFFGFGFCVLILFCFFPLLNVVPNICSKLGSSMISSVICANNVLRRSPGLRVALVTVDATMHKLQRRQQHMQGIAKAVTGRWRQ
jgi:hypothetical protein